MALKKFIDQHAKKIEDIETKSHEAWWKLATLGEEKYQKQLEETKIALRTIYSSKEDYEFLLAHKTPDPLLARQRDLLLNQYRENQIPQEFIEKITSLETEIEAIYTNFRPSVEEEVLSNNDLKKILVESLDSEERRKAWEASKLIGEQVEKKVLQLVSLRNESARKAGFSNYYTMSLELQELDEERLFQILDSLEKLTNPYWEKYKAELDEKLAKNYRLSPKELFPWHYHDPFFQEAPRAELDLDGYYKGKDLVEIARDFFKEVGLPADDILARSDLYEREKKSQHAFCSCLDRQQDVRILCNMRENEYWMGTLLHELGHGVYDKYIDQTLPYLLRTYAHISTTEASAMLFGRFSKNGDFLQKYCGVDEKEAKRIDLLAKQQTAATLLVFARWALVMVHFERAMYQKPGIDLRSFWWDCVERFQGVKRVPKRNAPDWASKLHLACAPVYYQNYALGEMTASQLFYHIQRVLKAPKESFCNSGKVGKFLQAKLFSQGAKRPWEETLMAATGDKLDSKYFAEDIIHIKNK